MQILTADEKIDNTTVALVDLDSHLLINGVPYIKETNTPIPFNYLNIYCVKQNKLYGKGLSPTLRTHLNDPKALYNCPATSSVKTQNVLIDKNDPSILYIACLNNDETGEYVVYKIKILETNKLKIIGKRTLSTSIKSGIIVYFTQDDENIYLIRVDNPWVSTTNISTTADVDSFFAPMRSKPYLYKLSKETLLTNNYCSFPEILYPAGYSYRYASASIYQKFQLATTDFVVLKEFENQGLICYIKNKRIYSGLNPKASSSTAEQCYWAVLYYYDFKNNTLTKITADENYPFNFNLGNCESYAYPSVTIPTKYLHKNNKLYNYWLEPDAMGSAHTLKIWLAEQDENDILKITFKEIEIFNENDLTLPKINTYRSHFLSSNTSQSSDSFYESFYSASIVNASYEIYTTNYDGIDYLHVFLKGNYNNPNDQRGIYTFKVNEEKTSAKLISFYPTLGGSLRDYYPLTEDGRKILVSTATSYHILNFDLESETWISGFDALNPMQSCIQTNENKLYVLLADNSIVCHDLNGAVIIDFDFEQQSYNYSGSEIDSYVSIWAKDSEDNYVETDVKLTIVGNCIWKENGSQTLVTKTSDTGPINIPFTIKGQTSINVSIDAMI